MAGPGGHWLGLDACPVPALYVVPLGTQRQRGRMMVSFNGTLAKLPLCYKRYILVHPRLHLPSRFRSSVIMADEPQLL